MSEFESRIFGKTRNPTDAERQAIAIAVQETPVAVFQELSKAFHNKGLCIAIMTTEELQ